MAKFFVPSSNISGEEVVISGNDAHHLAKVLRIEVGQDVQVTTDAQETFLVCITDIGADMVKGKIIQKQHKSQEPPVELVLFQGLAKGDKMDWVVQKAVELGVSKVLPFISRYTVVKLDRSKEEKRRKRWQRIALEAAKQSKRDKIPEVEDLLTFDQLVAAVGDYQGEEQLMVVPYELEESRKITDLAIQPPKRIGIIIGPEGGFSEAELERLAKAGAVPITLGPRILRTETAGLVALSLVGYRWGDLA